MKTEDNNKVQIVNEPQQLAAQNWNGSFNFFDPVQFNTMQRVCKLFASSELVPEIYKVSDKNPIEKAMANCMIAIEVAQRIGASPLMVMQNIVIIYGRPSWSSKFLISTVNTCGRFNPLQFRFTEKGMLGIVEYTEYNKVWTVGSNGKGTYKNESKKSTFDGRNIMNIECVAWTRAKGSDEILESAPISLRLAIQEGWYQKAGSKWQTMPKQMLMYRAASFWTNVYAPELSMGMKTVEETQDIIDVVPIEEEHATDKLNKEKEAKANKIVVDIDQLKEEHEPIVTATTSIKDELEATTTNDLMFS
jgi:hypothetical protein